MHTACTVARARTAADSLTREFAFRPVGQHTQRLGVVALDHHHVAVPVDAVIG